MLGAAWVGAKAPTPAGPVNPFTLGFKAWESNIWWCYDGVFETGFALEEDAIPVAISASMATAWCPVVLVSPLITCPVGKQSMRMLGAAWVGAKAPTPAGPVNPI
jgi:hypothetical protein